MAPCSTKSASQSGERDVFEQPQNVMPRTSLEGHHQAPLKTPDLLLLRQRCGRDIRLRSCAAPARQPSHPITSEGWSGEVAFRERATRACLQVAFELACRLGVPEFDRDDDVPRTIAMASWIAPAAQHVDESLLVVHANGCRTNRSVRFVEGFERCVSDWRGRYSDSDS